jgi:aryl-alcohol dehydrogenase-like predicted oxidoreductase
VEETVTAFNDLIKAGKVRQIGASNISAERITVGGPVFKYVLTI